MIILILIYFIIYGNNTNACKLAYIRKHAPNKGILLIKIIRNIYILILHLYILKYASEFKCRIKITYFKI
jgi:hypothetical protein